MIIVFFFLAACESGDLSREKAKSLIENSPEFVKVYTEMDSLGDSFDRGVMMGFWDTNGRPAKEVSTVIRRAQPYGNTIELLKSYTKKLDRITGIADTHGGEGKIKDVEYTWRYEDLHALAKSFAADGGDGRASLQLYDDGWRLKDILIFPGDKPAVIGSDESEEIGKVSTTIAKTKEDQDKAKEVTVAFLKAIEAKDLNAIMNTVDVPFELRGKGGTIAKTDELKEKLKTVLEAPRDKLRIELGMVLDLPAFRKMVEERKGKGEVMEQLEKVLEKVLGTSGYAVTLVRDGKDVGGILVRVKDGQAKVVGIMQ